MLFRSEVSDDVLNSLFENPIFSSSQNKRRRLSFEGPDAPTNLNIDDAFDAFLNSHIHQDAPSSEPHVMSDGPGESSHQQPITVETLREKGLLESVDGHKLQRHLKVLEKANSDKDLQMGLMDVEIKDLKGALLARDAKISSLETELGYFKATIVNI